MKAKLPALCVIVTLLLVALSARASGPVKAVDAVPVTSGLQGKVIALWGSHGRYYNLEEDAWRWQRAHLLQTIEDTYTSSYVIDLLAPMLENAGAYVMMPRERDLSDVEVIIDADSPATPGYAETNGANRWSNAVARGFAMPTEPLGDKDNPFLAGKVRMVAAVSAAKDESTATWSARIPRAGIYTVYISYAMLPNASNTVTYTVNSLRGSEKFIVDQTMGGGTWIRLGEFPFAEGTPEKPIVTVSNLSTGRNVGMSVSADAVKIGGGMGNVSRGSKAEPAVSGLPRWLEGARYWLQWAGMPPSVYSESDYKNDYTDDFKSRPLWVNYLAGGSPRLPNEEGLKIPVDLSFALHSDAGVTADSTIVGTLGILSTDGGKRLGDGRSRKTNRELTEAVVTQITDDIRELYYPAWERRKIRDKRYAEARIPQVPATLIELLSHQNFADMRLGLDPAFRFDVSRAIYKGILRYFNPGKNATFVVQPLPVSNFAIVSKGAGHYTLKWRQTDDPLEPTAKPRTYYIEKAGDDGVFRRIANTGSTSWDYIATDGEISSFRIIAANAGGISFPSEVLTLGWFDNYRPEVLIVNGFTRVSGPESFDVGDEAGFLDEMDPGVPYKRNIAYSGSQYEFDRSREWKDDIVDPGFGASSDNFDGRPVAGNTFDFPAIHGRAMAASKQSFTSTSLGAYMANPSDYKQTIIDLILGRQREIAGPNADAPTRFKAFPAMLQKNLASHCKKGGSLLVSGEFVGSDLLANPFSNDSTLAADTSFAHKVLGIEHESAFAAVSGRVRVLPFWANRFTKGNLAYSSRLNSDIYAAVSPDAIVGSGRGNDITIMSYDENGKSAAIASRNSDGSSVISMGFPFETITTTESRAALMEQLLEYLLTVKHPIAPRCEQLTPPAPETVVPEVPRYNSPKLHNFILPSNIANI